MQYRLKMAEERNVKFFDRPSKEQALFVINNRNFSNLECNYDRKYDLVIGPVADDDLALLFRQFSGGLINADVLVEAMKFKKLTNQYSFHAERALGFLEKRGGIMDKRDQLIEYIIQDIIVFLVEDEGMDFEDAMKEFYASDTYMKLVDKETGLYYESAAYVYDMYKDEKRSGSLQNKFA